MSEYDTARREAAKSLGLLTIREWLAKYMTGDHVAGLVGDFTLDGGRGFVRDEPPRVMINPDGTTYVSCGGAVVLGLPGPVSVEQKAPGCGGGWYWFNRNGAFYFTMEDRKLEFAEAG